MRTEHAGSGEPLGNPERITLHWTAGNYDQTFDHYHFCVKGSGEVVQTLSLKLKGSHCWKRNSGNIGVSMCCMASNKFPPTDKQREATARLVAELMGIYGIALEDVQDHAYWAKADKYFPERWDIGPEMVPMRERIKKYRQQLESGKIANTLVGKVA